MASSQGTANAGSGGYSLSSDKFLTVAVNLLHKAFFDNTRTAAKGIFRELQEGRVVKLTNLQLEDKSTVRFDLDLDASEYRGKLGFSGFRASLGLLINNIAEAIRKQQEVKTFTHQQNPQARLFGITAVTVEGREPSVLVLGADTGGPDAVVRLNLLYLDHRQFQESPEEGVA
jgi:hypothetical protein